MPRERIEPSSEAFRKFLDEVRGLREEIVQSARAALEEGGHSFDPGDFKPEELLMRDQDIFQAMKDRSLTLQELEIWQAEVNRDAPEISARRPSSRQVFAAYVRENMLSEYK